MACEVDVTEVDGTNSEIQLTRESGKLNPILIKNGKRRSTAIRSLGARNFEISKEMTVHEKKQIKKNGFQGFGRTLSSLLRGKSFEN